MSHCNDDFPIRVRMSVFEIYTKHIGCFTDDFNILDNSKIQDAILLKVFAFDILCKFKDFVYSLKNMLPTSLIPNLLSHISKSYRYLPYVLRKIIKYLQ